MSAPALAPPRKRDPWEIQQAVLFALMLREFRSRVGRRWSGVAWMLLEPLANVMLILAVFGYLRNISSPNMEFPIFLVSGLLPYFLFRNLAHRLTEAIDGNRALYAYRQVKPLDAVIARGIVECVLWLAVLVLTLSVLDGIGWHAVPANPLQLFAAAGLMCLLGSGTGLLVAVATHGLPKVRKVVNMIYLPLYILSGVIFSIQRLPRSYQEWLIWNPLLHLVELSRSAFEPRYHSGLSIGFGYPAAVGLVVLTLALALYRRDRQRLLREE